MRKIIYLLTLLILISSCTVQKGLPQSSRKSLPQKEYKGTKGDKALKTFSIAAFSLVTSIALIIIIKDHEPRVNITPGGRKID